MYDFLDKIGLKAVLTAIKEKIPTSLPANGGNADTLGNKHASEFANSYNDDLMKFLNGQSGDIRTLVQQLPLGGYIFNTTMSELSGITFPIYGNGIMSWVACKYSANDLRYGILIIRPMLSTGYTYICSVYNTYSYTDWEQISTTPIKSTTFSGTTDTNGNLMLWAVSENKIPICAVLTGYCSSIFHYAPDGNYYLGVSDITTGAYSPNVSVDGTVYYIEQG